MYLLYLIASLNHWHIHILNFPIYIVGVSFCIVTMVYWNRIIYMTSWLSFQCTFRVLSNSLYPVKLYSILFPSSTISVFPAPSLSQLYANSDISLAILWLITLTVSDSLTSFFFIFSVSFPSNKQRQGASSDITSPSIISGF